MGHYVFTLTNVLNWRHNFLLMTGREDHPPLHLIPANTDLVNCRVRSFDLLSQLWDHEKHQNRTLHLIIYKHRMHKNI